MGRVVLRWYSSLLTQQLRKMNLVRAGVRVAAHEKLLTKKATLIIFVFGVLFHLIFMLCNYSIRKFKSYCVSPGVYFNLRTPSTSQLTATNL